MSAEGMLATVIATRLSEALERDGGLTDADIESAAEKADCKWLVKEYRASMLAFARAILATTPAPVKAVAPEAEVAPGRPLFDFTLDEDAVKFLRDAFTAGDDPCEWRFMIGDGYDGFGLYACEAEYPEEGSSFVQALTRPATPPAAQGAPVMALAAGADGTSDGFHLISEEQIAQLEHAALGMEAIVNKRRPAVSDVAGEPVRTINDAAKLAKVAHSRVANVLACLDLNKPRANHTPPAAQGAPVMAEAVGVHPAPIEKVLNAAGTGYYRDSYVLGWRGAESHHGIRAAATLKGQA